MSFGERHREEADLVLIGSGRAIASGSFQIKLHSFSALGNMHELQSLS